MAPEGLLSLNVMRARKLGQHKSYFIEEALIFRAIEGIKSNGL